MFLQIVSRSGIIMHGTLNTFYGQDSYLLLLRKFALNYCLKVD